MEGLAIFRRVRTLLLIDALGWSGKCQSIYFAALPISQRCFVLITFHSHLLCQNCHRREQKLKDYIGE